MSIISTNVAGLTNSHKASGHLAGAAHPRSKKTDASHTSSASAAAAIPFSFKAAEHATHFHTGLSHHPSQKSFNEYRPAAHRAHRAIERRRVQDMLAGMRDTSSDNELDGLAKRLIAGDNPHQVLRQWSGGDESKQYLALMWAIAYADQHQAGVDTVEALRDMAAYVEKQDGGAIHAGLNSIEQAAAFGPTRQDADTFRATYRDAVLGQASFSDTLALLLERFDDKIEAGIALMRQALGADLASIRPSQEPERLNAILQDLYQLAAAVTVLQRCQIIVNWLQHSDPLLVINDRTLMRDLVGWTKLAWVMNYHVTQLIEKYHADQIDADASRARDKEADSDDERGGAANDEADQEEGDDIDLADVAVATQARLLNHVLDIMRRLPDRVFPREEQRMRCIDSLREVLDVLLAKGDE